MSLARKLIKMIRSSPSDKRQFPLQIDITNACNLRCKHCYHEDHKNSGNLNLEQWIKVINSYKDFLAKYEYSPSLIICGGEPLISPFLKPIVEYVHATFDCPPIYILTNGVKIEQSFLDWSSDFPNMHFQISIDGPNANDHDYIRGWGTFNKTLKSIEQLKSYKLPFSVQTVLSSRTSSKIHDFFELANRKSFPSMNFTRFIGTGIGREFVNSGLDRALSPLELKKAFEDILIGASVYQVKTATNQPLFSLIDPRLGTSYRRWRLIVVDFKGFIRISSRTNHPLGHVFKEGIESTVIGNPIFKSLQKSEIKTCGSCKYIKTCGGDRNAAYVEFGSILERDPACWIA